VDFLVDITVRLPPAIQGDELERLIAAERERGRELVDAGAIKHIWRIPGALRNVSIWSAEDPTALHALLRSLPTYRFTEISVTALAAHPLQGGPPDG
jgi:muconolactone D-isomerase